MSRLAALRLVLVAIATGLWIAACQPSPPATTEAPTPPVQGTRSTGGVESELRLGALLPATGDLSAIGQPMVKGIDFLVDTVNACGGVLGKPIAYIKADDRTDPVAGTEAATKLVQVDNVGAIVGAFASSVSAAAISVAAPNKVVMVSPGSTSPVFTERAKKGELDQFWNRTAPPDTYQAAALANLAFKKGLKKVATIAINNDYGVGFERVFVETFEKLGGTITNKANPTRYDPKAATFEAEVRGALGSKPDGLAAILYPETGGAILKAAYEQGLLAGVQVLLTDGVQTEDFAQLVGKTPDGKPILAGALGTVPGADGPALATFSQAFREKTNTPVGAYVPHSYDAAALIAIAAEAAKSGRGEAIAGQLRVVANPPGEEVSDVCQALALVREGKEVNYQGASSNVDLDEFGDVQGSYDVWTFTDAGKIEVVDRVSS